MAMVRFADGKSQIHVLDCTQILLLLPLDLEARAA
jgi:hypothetical protein